MSKRAFLVEWLKLTGTPLYFRSEMVRDVEHVLLEGPLVWRESRITMERGYEHNCGWEGEE